MPNMAKDDEKAKRRIENERQLTIVMMIYIGKLSFNILSYKLYNKISPK